MNQRFDPKALMARVKAQGLARVTNVGRWTAKDQRVKRAELAKKIQKQAPVTT